MSDLFTNIRFEARVLVVEDSEEGKTGLVNFHGVRIPVNFSFLPGIQVGDVVLIEGRVALSQISRSAGTVACPANEVRK